MADASPFVGTWKLVSWEVTQPDGAIHYLCLIIGAGNQKLTLKRAVEHA